MTRLSLACLLAGLFCGTHVAAQMGDMQSMDPSPFMVPPGAMETMQEIQRNSELRLIACGAAGRADKILADCTELLAGSALRGERRVAAFVHRARAHLRLGQSREAILDYEQALLLQPDSLPAALGRALARRAGGDTAHAVSDFDAVIALKPGVPELYIYRAVAHSQSGDDAAALADLDRALTLDPANETARLDRNIVLYRQSVGPLPSIRAAN
jgi:lipoprotein NlpI